MNIYFADRDGWRLLVTPWPMLCNEGGLQELTSEQCTLPQYSAVLDDAAAFYRTAGAGSALVFYEVQSGLPGAPVMVGTFWLTGPFGPYSLR